MSPFVALLDSIGSSELLVILLLVLIFFGGDKMPEFARGVAKIMREFRKAASGVEQEFKRVIEEEPPPPARPTQITPTTPTILPPNPSNAALPPPPTSSAQPFQPYGIQAEPNDDAPAPGVSPGAAESPGDAARDAHPAIDEDGVPRPVPPAQQPAPPPRPAGDVDAG